MKKIILSVAVAVAALLTTEVSAQEYKPAAGQNTLELQLAPLGANPFTMGGIRFRRFTSETSAIRATVYVGYMNETEIKTQEGPGQKELKIKNSSFEVGLRPGIEKHFAGTDRLSPYIGAELDFAIKTSTKKEDNGGAGGSDVTVTTTKNDDGFTRFGLNGVFGADYYVAEKVYLGAELGFGFSYSKESAVKVSDTAPGFVAPDDVKGGSTFAIAPNVLAQFRLGIVF
jgi:opacity protein-like surface antigen